MSHKATKKLLAKAMETQKAAPKPLGLKPGVVKQIAFEQEVTGYKGKLITSAKLESVSITPTGYAIGIRDLQIEPVKEKLRGYKVVQTNPQPIANGAPSKLF